MFVFWAFYIYSCSLPVGLKEKVLVGIQHFQKYHDIKKGRFRIRETSNWDMSVLGAGLQWVRSWITRQVQDWSVLHDRPIYAIWYLGSHILSGRRLILQFQVPYCIATASKGGITYMQYGTKRSGITQRYGLFSSLVYCIVGVGCIPRRSRAR
jgi:hypothetical protein